MDELVKTAVTILITLIGSAGIQIAPEARRPHCRAGSAESGAYRVPDGDVADRVCLKIYLKIGKGWSL